MKKNKLLLVIILMGFLTFGMSYNNVIKENVVTPFIKQVAKVEKQIVAVIAPAKKNTAPAKEETSVNAAAAAPAVTVTNAVVVNGGGNAKPGSQLDFTITINNTGTDAAGTTFQDILDTNLTLVAGSLKATPIAVNDAYNCIGNVGITLNAAQGILANDVSPDGTALTAAILANGSHGVAAIAANGSFTYNPAAGYSGTDSFTYTLTSANGKTDTATVTITISAPIYFVNSSVATNGTGTLLSPFKLVQNATGTGSNPIFIYTGAATSGTTLTLSDNQKVIGQGATAGLATILGLIVPSYSNALPTTGGTNPTFSSISLKANNDIQAVILSSDMTGTSVGNLKVRNASITGGSAVAVNINGGGTLDCIFQSVSANGGAGGIVISNASGSFQITGTGSTAGSGGTIQNITNGSIGAQFTSCTNISLKNMNFTSAGLFGIKINNVTNFELANSVLSNCGNNISGSETGGIYATNLKGTNTITNTNVNDSWGRGFYAYNDSGFSNLTITGSQFKNAFNKANGDSNFIFEGYGTSNNTLVLKSNDFSNAKNYGLTLNFGGTSTNTIQVGGNNPADGNVINAAASSPGSNGLSLQANTAATVNYNIINNTIKSSFGGSFTCNVGNQDTGTMNGRINFNIIDGGGAGSVANGISVAAYGNAKHITEIVNNTITNANNYGIVSEANDNGSNTASARMDATIKNNNISLVADSYAHVSVISVGTATSTLISAANIGNNTTNAPANLGAATFDVLSYGAGNKVILQGATALATGSGDRSADLTTFWNANNTAATRTAKDELGGGTIISGTAATPSNASASKMVTPKETEKTTPIAESQNNNQITNKSSGVNSTAKTTSGETISVGPFTLAGGKSTVITFSATINAVGSLPANTCAVTNQASVSGTNFASVNSNITTTSIKPGNATFTNSTENIPCLGSTAVTLNATCPLGTTATWYTALTGGSSFATGASATATPTANNTTYCVACEAAYCASDRLLVKTVTGTPSTTSAPENISVCDSYTWPVNGTNYTASGTYTAVVGCDTKTLNLTITPSTSSTPEVITACDSYTWAANGTKYTSSGTYTAVVGCDTKTLNLTITPSTSSTPETESACDSYTWPVNGTKYTSSGTYSHTNGCDTKTLVLTITNSTASTETVTACDSYTWAENGTKYTSSGTYVNNVGCDTKTLVLTITNSTASTETVTACDSYTWAENGTKYTTSGTYVNNVGCDTKTLVLTITNSTASTETIAACDSYTWAENGTQYTSSGTYVNNVGCDTKTLVLTITNSTASTETIAACDSYTWAENGTKYTSSGTYVNNVGCDTKTLVLTITNSTASTETIAACDSYTWAENGTKYTSSGTYVNNVGCDTKTLVLTITNSTASTETIAACDSYTWAENGTKYTSSGTYVNNVGCDTKTLVLTITNSTASTETIAACDSYTWAENGIQYTSSGTYSYTNGCDTKTLELTINNSSAISNTVSLNSGTLTSNHLGATYQWYKCPNTLLSNETNQSYTPLTSGDYKVEITVGECTIASDCVTVTSLAVGQFKPSEFKLYPNPSNGILNIVTANGGNYSIIDQTGKSIKLVHLNENAINTINLEDISEGIYFIKNTGNSKIKAEKFIIKK
ncbi:T9SS type A sorting domain-containing protein [Flavobacterium sp. LC2016-23]|uniref:Ig-like domain-containing protein n=1 Tax=Flavobacterium sp. LC2016-23 TaxID=2666330 RepID=UPI0012B07AE4|nr:Ig-like domain-containing protein [Flavobacterium sp. LC2016-23]MRX39285.1 T9SS type A sorting domain-containing protein [Flavobacterium sp. LC2016-23]